MQSELDNEVTATNQNKALQKKLQRKPLPEAKPGPAVKDLPEQESLLQSGLKRMQTTSDAVKTKANKATEDKIHDVVSSRKQISRPTGNASISKTAPSKKAVPYKR